MRYIGQNTQHERLTAQTAGDSTTSAADAARQQEMKTSFLYLARERGRDGREKTARVGASASAGISQEASRMDRDSVHLPALKMPNL